MNASDLLETMKRPEFDVDVMASTPRMLRSLLGRMPKVLRLRELYDGGFVSSAQLRRFVDGLLREGREADRFPYQITLAAIAVMLERRFTDFAEEYLTDLARLKSPRFTMASGVAQVCLRARNSCVNAIKIFPPQRTAYRGFFWIPARCAPNPRTCRTHREQYGVA